MVRKSLREIFPELLTNVTAENQKYISRAYCKRRLKVILSASIYVSLSALIATMLKFWALLLSQHIYIFEIGVFPMNKRSSGVDPRIASSIYHTQPASLEHLNPMPSARYTSGTAEHDYAGTKYILVLDFWERMINIQSGLRRLVQLGVDSGFTVVEPFVYESRVSLKFSFPEDFKSRNMTPQTAALYFRTEDLYMTNRYISHAHFRDQAKLVIAYDEEKGVVKNRAKVNQLLKEPKNDQYLIQAMVYINWTTTKKDSKQSFGWCDSILVQKKLPITKYGRLVGSNIHVQRALCVSSAATVSPARFTSRFFDDIFAFVRQGTRKYRQKCGKCIALAFMNYRKHAFSGFIAHTGAMPFKQKSPPLEVGTLPQALAERVKTELLGGRPYVAIQLRTGKAFALFEGYDRRKIAEGISVSRHSNFKSWLNNCTTSLVRAARRVARELGPHTVFYIASDMYNDGWKGGEICPPVVQEVLERSKAILDKELNGLRWFNPKEFGITQDAMGISGLADAAVCLKADRFMFAVPSNFGKWIHEQRSYVKEGAGTVRVDCMDHRFIGV